MYMVGHKDKADDFTIILIAVVVQTIDDGNNKGRACEYFNSAVDITGDVKD